MRLMRAALACSSAGADVRLLRHPTSTPPTEVPAPRRVVARPAAPLGQAGMRGRRSALYAARPLAAPSIQRRARSLRAAQPVPPRHGASAARRGAVPWLAGGGGLERLRSTWCVQQAAAGGSSVTKQPAGLCGIAGKEARKESRGGPPPHPDQVTNQWQHRTVRRKAWSSLIILERLCVPGGLRPAGTAARLTDVAGYVHGAGWTEEEAHQVGCRCCG